MGFSTIEQALSDLRAGKLIVCIDDPSRENEGDLICAAEFASAELVNRMAGLARSDLPPGGCGLCQKARAAADVRRKQR